MLTSEKLESWLGRPFTVILIAFITLGILTPDVTSARTSTSPSWMAFIMWLVVIFPVVAIVYIGLSNGRGFLEIAFGGLIVAPTIGCISFLFTILNVKLDDSKGVDEEHVIVGKHISSSRSAYRIIEYRAAVDRTLLQVRVPRAVYDSKNIDDTLHLCVRQGFFGAQWIERFSSCASP